MQSLNSVAVNLPKGEAERLQEKEPVTLTITHDSRIFVDKTPTTLESLAFVLKPLLAPPTPQVIVSADSAAAEGTVVQAMLQARRAGVEHFLIAVKRE
jgi:biopolymer transport protein ExbD